MRHLAPLFALIVVACATVPETPRERLAAAEIAYTAAVREINVLRAAGQLTLAELQAARAADRAATQALDLAHAAIAGGQPIDSLLAVVQAQVQTMLATARRKRGTP